MRATSFRSFLLGAAALALAYVGQILLRGDNFADAVLCFGGAVLLFLAVFWRQVWNPITPFGLAGDPFSSRPRWVWGAAAALLAGALALLILALRTFDQEAAWQQRAWWEFWSSLALALAAPVTIDWGGRRLWAQPTRVRWIGWGRSWLIWLAVAGILLLGAFFRLYRFASLPFGTWYDEAEYGLQAMRILQSDAWRPVFEGAINGPAHYLYLVALSFQLLGVSTQAIRAVNVLFGLGTVLAAYFVGRELFGRAGGLIAAFLLAVSSWSVTLSRFGMHSTSTTPFFILITLVFLLRGLRRGLLTDYALAGAAMGLGLCFYTSFRLFLPAVGLFLVQVAAVAWWRTRRPPPGGFWIGLLCMALLAAIVVAPIALYAYRHPDIFWARVEDTFILARRGDSNPWPVLMDSLRKHLLMFNWKGDSNGRHNLPGNPMLDDVTAALFVVGLAYSLRRAADPRYALLPIWLAFALLGGILSLDFEAPQSLRSNGALAAAYLLAAVPLVVLLRAWQTSVGRYYPRAAWIAVGALLAAVAAANFNTYFVRQANDFAVWNAFSTPETLAAQRLAARGPDVDAYVTSYFYGHPTLRFLDQHESGYRRLETTDELPLTLDATRPALLISNAESRDQFEEAQRLYPNAQFEEVKPPMDGPPVLFTALLAPSDIASIQGLRARYYLGGASTGAAAVDRKENVLDFDWADAPAPLPAAARWDGLLRVPAFGAYSLALNSPGRAALTLDETVVLSGTGFLSTTLLLARGSHLLRIDAQGAPGRMTLAWQTPQNDTLTVIPAAALYGAPVTANGLLGRYFPNGAWTAPEASAAIDSVFRRYIHVPPLLRPYTVEWTGKIAIPETGRYGFGLESIDESMLDLDGAEVVSATTHNEYSEGVIDLTSGLHDIRIRLADRTDHTHINVYWTPPGGERQILPGAVLFPPLGNYAHVRLPNLADVIQPLGPVQGPSPGPVQSVEGVPLLDGRATVAMNGLTSPRAIAVSPNGSVYVADGGDHPQIHLLQNNGAASVLPQPAVALGEPADLAVDYASLYVLDAAAGQVYQFDLTGSAERRVPFNAVPLRHARGLALGADGSLWVAATAEGKLAGLALDGGQRQIAVGPGQDAQPTDLAVGRDGWLLAIDPVGRRLIRFSPDGQRERMWPASAANTLDSPHLAVDEQGFFYLTEPETGRVVKLDVAGAAVGAWDLRQLTGRQVRPVGVAVGPDGRVWVTDVDGGAVIVITPGR